MKDEFTFIDLFAGAGGLSEGFIQAGFIPIAHVEMDLHACNTLRTRSVFHYLKKINRLDIYEQYLLNKHNINESEAFWNQAPPNILDSIINKEISENNIKDIFKTIDSLRKEKEIDIIIGGPPCQAYSTVGRARVGESIKNDPRNELYLFYIEFLKKYKPKMFVFENVCGIKTAKNGEPFKNIKSLVEELGYEMEYKIQLASDYGVLQKRKRIIITGWQKNFLENDPSSYHYPTLTAEPNSYEILKDLFSDLPPRKSGEGNLIEVVKYTKDLNEMPYLKNSGIRGLFEFTTQHISRPHNKNDREIYYIAINKWKKHKERLSYETLPPRLQNHKNKNSFLDRFRVIDPSGLCHTLVAHIAKDGHYYIYPTEEPTIENVRSITVREAARIQSFPDDYFFEGSRSSAFKQIGNAVPVRLAYKIAQNLKLQLERTNLIKLKS